MTKRTLAAVALVAAASVARVADGSDRKVRPEDLAAIIESADRVAVVEDDLETRKQTVLFSSLERSDLRDLGEALRVVRAEGVCGCIGTLHIELYRANDRTASIDYVGSRIKIGDVDGTLVDRDKLLAWFDSRGIPGPRRDAHDEAVRKERGVASERRWVEAMPVSLRALWDEARNSTIHSGLDPDLRPWRVALEQGVPDQGARITGLLSWYGSGDGPWSGYPAYEGMAEALLLAYETPDLVAAVDSNLFDDRVVEGGARLFATHAFRDRPNASVLVPQHLKNLLLEHSLKDPNDDKRERAKGAFGS